MRRCFSSLVLILNRSWHAGSLKATQSCPGLRLQSRFRCMFLWYAFVLTLDVYVTQSVVRSSSRAEIGDGTSLHMWRPVVSRPWKGRVLITMGVLFPYGFSSAFKGYFDLLRSLAVSAAQLMFQSKRHCLVWLTWSRCALNPAVRCSCICT